MSIAILLLAASIGNLASLQAVVPAAQPLLDGFETLDNWTPIHSDGVSLRLAQDSGRTGKAMRIDYDYQSHAGFVLAQRLLGFDLPKNYEFSFWIRGKGPSNNLEFKLMDDTGDNVWWVNRVNFAFPTAWQKIVVRKRHLKFAWGPKGGGELAHAATMQFGVAANSGGKGSLWIDDLQFRELPPVSVAPIQPLFTASETAPGSSPAMAGDGKRDTAWVSGSMTREQTLTADFGAQKEFGGVTVQWGLWAGDALFERSTDSIEWDLVHTVRGGTGDRTSLFLPDSEARYIRVRLLASSLKRASIREVTIEPVELGASINTFFSRIAMDAPRAFYPRYFHGEQSYFTVIGTNGGMDEALINTDGQIEVGKLKFSIEPFVFCGGRLQGWSDKGTSQGLADGYLPVPWVRREADGLRLQVSAFKAEAPKGSTEPLYARYSLTNTSKVHKKGKLFISLRPFLVNPPWFDLNTIGGAAEIHRFDLEGGAVTVDGRTVVRPVGGRVPFGAASFDEGDITTFLANGVVPTIRSGLADAFGHASGAFAVSFDLAPRAALRQTLEVDCAKPAGSEAVVERREKSVIRQWRGALSSFDVTLPKVAHRYVEVLKSNLAYIMVNRDGPGIQPGSRCYERSWMRDGALTSGALLRMGRQKEVKEFLQWFAKYQFENGAIPCVVDRRGADPVPEHDSHGQFIFAVMEYFRFTKDRAFLASIYPRIVRTVSHIQDLRALRTTDEFALGDDEKRAFYGLVPESISHEGYSAKPMHSYWDDLFVLKGLKDATEAATILGKRSDATRFGTIRDEFARCLYESMKLAIANRKIDYIPGCVELGDFDATSTAIAVYPCGELDGLPQPELDRTFAKYAEFFDTRAKNMHDWGAYTPYEIRICNTLLMMGQPGRAFRMTDYFLKDLRPQGWNQWAEVVTRDPKKPQFLGDMPHTWVGSEFVKVVRNMLVCEREDDESLVLGLGIPEQWLSENEPIAVRGLPSCYGPVSYTLTSRGRFTKWSVRAGFTLPRGGIWLRSPIDTPVYRAKVNGKAAPLVGNMVKVTKLPATVEVENAGRM